MIKIAIGGTIAVAFGLALTPLAEYAVFNLLALVLQQ